MKRSLLLSICLAIAGTAAVAAAEDLPDFDKLWDYSDPAATERVFRELLPRAEKSGNLDYHLQLLTQIARTLGLQGKFEEAHAVLDEVEKKLTDDCRTANLRYLLERGRAFNSSGKPDLARPLFLKAWQQGRAWKDDELAVDAAHMMGIVEPTEKQLEWNLKALEVVEASKDRRVRGWKGALYNNIGMTYLDQEDYETAYSYFLKGYGFHLRYGNPTSTRIAKWTVAHALRKLGRLEPALLMQREMEKECAARGEPDGFVCEEIGEILLAQEEPDEATPYFKRAYAILKDIDWVVESDPERVERLKKLAGAE